MSQDPATVQDLPELPEPPSYESAYDDAPLTDHYSAHQMQAYARTAVEAAISKERERYDQLQFFIAAGVDLFKGASPSHGDMNAVQAMDWVDAKVAAAMRGAKHE